MPARSALLAAILLAAQLPVPRVLAQTHERAHRPQRARRFQPAGPHARRRRRDATTTATRTRSRPAATSRSTTRAASCRPTASSTTATTKRVFAQGHAKLTERDGSVALMPTGSSSPTISATASSTACARMSADKTHFNAERAERIGGETTVFENGELHRLRPCKDDPAKPPLWRVRAKRSSTTIPSRRSITRTRPSTCSACRSHGCPISRRPTRP